MRYLLLAALLSACSISNETLMVGDAGALDGSSADAPSLRSDGATVEDEDAGEEFLPLQQVWVDADGTVVDRAVEGSDGLPTYVDEEGLVWALSLEAGEVTAKSVAPLVFAGDTCDGDILGVQTSEPSHITLQTPRGIYRQLSLDGEIRTKPCSMLGSDRLCTPDWCAWERVTKPVEFVADEPPILDVVPPITLEWR